MFEYCEERGIDPYADFGALPQAKKWFKDYPVPADLAEQVASSILTAEMKFICKSRLIGTARTSFSTSKTSMPPSLRPSLILRKSKRPASAYQKRREKSTLMRVSR